MKQMKWVPYSCQYIVCYSQELSPAFKYGQAANVDEDETLAMRGSLQTLPQSACYNKWGN